MALPPNLSVNDIATDNGIIYEILTVINAATADYEVRLHGSETTPVMNYAASKLETEAEVLKVRDPAHPNEEGLWEKYVSPDGKINYLKLTHQDFQVV